MFVEAAGIGPAKRYDKVNAGYISVWRNLDAMALGKETVELDLTRSITFGAVALNEMARIMRIATAINKHYPKIKIKIAPGAL